MDAINITENCETCPKLLKHKINFQKCSRLHKTELYKQHILLDPHSSANSFTQVSRFSVNPETYFSGVLHYNVLPITKASPRQKAQTWWITEVLELETNRHTNRTVSYKWCTCVNMAFTCPPIVECLDWVSVITTDKYLHYQQSKLKITRKPWKI
jgi:hypothetical protein